LLTIAVAVAIFLLTVTLHEVSHGVVAYYLGDPTAKLQGRLTLNPLKHIDPFWTVILPGLLFFSTGGRFAIGMAKPVPVDFSRLRNPKRDMILVALAGPAANIVLACILCIFWRFTDQIFLLYAIYFNLGLAVFNMIPIPPLDGSRVMAGLLPGKWATYYLKIERYGFMIVLVLYFTGILVSWVIPGVNFLCSLLDIPQIRLG